PDQNAQLNIRRDIIFDLHFLIFFLSYLRSIGPLLACSCEYLKEHYSNMSIPTDCEEKIFENISLPDSTSKPTSKDEHAAEIVRTPNAFLLYRSEKQLALRNKMNAPLPHDISRIVSLWWRATTPETKEYYRSLSHTDAIRQKARFMILRRKGCIQGKYNI
ncbi:hypothetical protein BGW37DRAFT_536824, partial [Umbelopsis sp. PMI_123]